MSTFQEVTANGEPYWYVFDETGRGAPKRKHQSRESACSEAHRLALANKGGRFVVLQATDVYVIEGFVHVQLVQLGHDIPF